MKCIKQVLVALFLCIVSLAKADEGMWLPLLLEKMNEKEMKSLGMKISAKDIYSINTGSLKDAIVSFGGFCTGEVISNKGLVLTNHHCGFDAIQNHSTLDRNYIRDGFWAKNNGEEIPNAGLFVTFIVRIEDVSKQVLNGVTATMNESERQSAIDKNMATLRNSVKREDYQDGFVRAFFEGNQYYMFITETYKDVRLVGAPPSAIGNFGKDTDNWMWPRHTGDFSMFRIYAGKDNKPAEYSADNIPYTPKKSLAISLDGVAENDFTMVFGFPGRTTEYLHSSAVEQIMNVNDPAKIAIREKALGVIDAFMRKDEQIKIQYAAKYANIQNAYKKWQGEVLGLTMSGAVNKKKLYEAAFQKRVEANPQWKGKYGSLLGDLDAIYAQFKPYGKARDYFTEIIGRVELLTIAAQLNSLITAYEKEGESGYSKRLPIVKEALNNVYAEYNPAVDQQLFQVLMEMYAKDQPEEYRSPVLKEMLTSAGGSFQQLAAKIYGETQFYDPAIAMKLLNKPSAELLQDLKSRQLIKLYTDILKTYQVNVQPRLNELQATINNLQRTYMQAQMEVMKEKKFYPDANSTLRVTYGKAKSYNARDAVKYDYYTYLEGVMEKYKPGDYEFDLPANLIEKANTKDYGQYLDKAKNDLVVCFITTNDITGGNSGSPVLDAYGNLIGLAFDGNYEALSHKIAFDKDLNRTICVDVRYVLWCIDKLGGASNIIKELKLVR